MRLRISARKSDLARLQAYYVGEALVAKNPGLQVDYLFRESLGDKNLNDPLWKMPEKGVFTEDFVADLLQEKTDLVVHSWKDLPTAPRNGTQIVATLPRADQRDLLLVKKSHFSKIQQHKKISIFSSSPRRAYNLENFLKSHLPFSLREVHFENVRGNIQTRVRKMLESSEVDGLILAKAAIDRLLTAKAAEFQETKDFLRQALGQSAWMVLPLSVNPNAAAQGALAIEIKEGRKDLLPLLKEVHCQKTFECAQKERDILASYGGGCHQKIGVAVLHRDYGDVLFLKGLTDSGQILSEGKIQRGLKKKISSTRLFSSSELPSQRETLGSLVLPPSTNALFVSRTEAIPETLSFGGIVWTAGLRTWAKLADRGQWVHGSSEGLGEQEDTRVEILVGSSLNWVKLSHQGAPSTPNIPLIATYKVSVDLQNWSIKEKDLFYWHSGSQFLAALEKEPRLREKQHACGPGNTYQILREALGPQANIEIYLNEEEWRSTCGL